MAKQYNFNSKNGYKGLIASIILRAVLDYQSVLVKNPSGTRRSLRNQALNFFKGEDFIFMCEVLEIDYKIILKNLDITKDTRFISLRQEQKPITYKKRYEISRKR